MPQPLSLDLRQRIVAAVHAGESKAAVARRFDVCRRTVTNYARLEAAGALEPKPNILRPLRKFTPQAVEAMKNWINKEKNDLTLAQMQKRLLDEFGISVSQVAVWDRLTAEKMTWKKKRPMPLNGIGKT